MNDQEESIPATPPAFSALALSAPVLEAEVASEPELEGLAPG